MIAYITFGIANLIKQIGLYPDAYCRVGERTSVPRAVEWRRSLVNALLALALAPASGWAATVTTNEAVMDSIFSLGSFSTPIDIRFNATVTVNGPVSLFSGSNVVIDTDAKLDDLFALAPSGLPTVNMFFVDTLDACGGVNPSIIGCANFPGNKLVVESGVAAGGSGAALNAHELGHNLGLDHEIGSGTNLMNPSLSGNTTLTSSQVSTIFSNVGGLGLVQTDGGSRFIQITPILLAAVPLPAALPLVLSALSVLGFIGRRRHAA
jgi:hypothetical protein